MHCDCGQAIVRTITRRSLKLYHLPPIPHVRSPMTAALTFHLPSELKRCPVVWKEFLKRLYRVLGALPNPFHNFSSLGIMGRYKEYSLTTTPIPPSTAQNHNRLLSPGRHPTCFLPRCLAMCLSTTAHMPVLPSISREKSVRQRSAVVGTHVYQTDSRYFVLSMPLGGGAKLGEGKGFEP
jgi:hypothetical protein